MSPAKQRIAIAEACGWKLITRNHFDEGVEKFAGYYQHPQAKWRCVQPRELPDYLNDLSVMHDTEKLLNAGQINSYIGYLYSFNKTAQVGSNPWEIIAVRVAVHATAAQRAEAFLRTLNLWEPSNPTIYESLGMRSG